MATAPQSSAPKKTANTTLSPQEQARVAAELKSKNFKEGVNLHVNRALASMEKVTKLSNRKRYLYDAEQAEKIVTALQRGLDAAKSSFTAAIEGKSDTSKFTL